MEENGIPEGVDRMFPMVIVSKSQKRFLYFPGEEPEMLPTFQVKYFLADTLSYK